MNPLIYCQEALQTLANVPSTRWAITFVKLKMEFTRRFSNGFIFSTRFGADFFQTTEEHLRLNTRLKPEKGEALGEYDLSYNKWLDITTKALSVTPA